MSGYCIVCLRARAVDPRNPICEDCSAARDHVVRMTIDPATGESVAECPCGWRRTAPWTRPGRESQDEAVHRHWRDVVAEGGSS